MLWTVIHEWKLPLWPLLLPLLLLFRWWFHSADTFCDFCLYFVLHFRFIAALGLILLLTASAWRFAALTGSKTTAAPHCLHYALRLFVYLAIVVFIFIFIFGYFCSCVFVAFVVFGFEGFYSLRFNNQANQCWWGLAATCGNTLKYYFATAAAFKGSR